MCLICSKLTLHGVAADVNDIALSHCPAAGASGFALLCRAQLIKPAAMCRAYSGHLQRILVDQDQC